MKGVSEVEGCSSLLCFRNSVLQLGWSVLSRVRHGVGDFKGGEEVAALLRDVVSRVHGIGVMLTERIRHARETKIEVRMIAIMNYAVVAKISQAFCTQ